MSDDNAGEDVILIVGGQAEGAGEDMMSSAGVEGGESPSRGRGPSEGCVATSNSSRHASTLGWLLIFLMWARRRAVTAT